MNSLLNQFKYVNPILCRVVGLKKGYISRGEAIEMRCAEIANIVYDHIYIVKYKQNNNNKYNKKQKEKERKCIQ